MYIALFTGEIWFFLLMHVKNYKSATLLACSQFTSDPFPWKRTGLARVEGERQFQGKAGRQLRAAEDQGGKPPGGLRLGVQRSSGQRAKSALSPQERKQVFCSEDLHSWLDGRKKLNTDWWVKVLPALLGGCDYPNVGMCGCLSA